MSTSQFASGICLGLMSMRPDDPGDFDSFPRFGVLRCHLGLHFYETFGGIVAVGAPQIVMHGCNRPFLLVLWHPPVKGAGGQPPSSERSEASNWQHADFQFNVVSLPKLNKPFKTSHFRRVAGQVELPEFSNNYHLNRKQNGNIYNDPKRTIHLQSHPQAMGPLRTLHRAEG